MLKNNTFLNQFLLELTFLNQFLLEFSSLWLPKIKKNCCFLGLYRKSWFCENHCFSNRKLLFFWFWASKNRPNFNVKKLSKMTSKKKALKSNLGIDFGLPNPPKLLQKAMLNEAGFATTCNSPGSRRKSTGAIALGLPIWLRIWLGLLYLSIYWSAPRRPNHQSKVCNLTCSTHISAHPTRQSKNTV